MGLLNESKPVKKKSMRSSKNSPVSIEPSSSVHSTEHLQRIEQLEKRLSELDQESKQDKAEIIRLTDEIKKLTAPPAAPPEPDTPVRSTRDGNFFNI